MSAPTIETLSAEITSLRSELKQVAKLVRKIRSFQEDPTGEKIKARTENNGFNRKLKVSEELRVFLDLPEGELISRSNVTRKLNEYIKEQGLKHPENGRIIVMDEKLSKLLNPPEGVQLTFLNMQKYISPHYIKDSPPAKTEEAPASPEDDAEKAKPKAKRPTVRTKKAA
jgi:chromatin remodeling complex protein RSC6